MTAEIIPIHSKTPLMMARKLLDEAVLDAESANCELYWKIQDARALVIESIEKERRTSRSLSPDV